METTSTEQISVIIPALDEAEQIGATLASTATAQEVELIVVDGGSQDDTVRRARSWNRTRVLNSPPGRARQMNVGARAALGGLLLFLHADTRLPPAFDREVRTILGRPGVAAGAFRFKIDQPSPWFRLIEWVANWRARRLQLPYGDQAIFLRAELFQKLGGFRELPIMEDFDLVRRLRSHGKIAIATIAAPTSARRWERVGPVRTTFLNQAIVLGFFLGLDPVRLARWYQER